MGDCLADSGSPATPALRVVQCGPGVFKVLRRFEGTSDRAKCKGVSGHTHDYFATEPPAFVLCMALL
ncbi:LppU/SCO3897 family protein [Dactylosporangium cerinum]|uniref:LppU/SCO3897 family protein n=1 Tax=Dactylosporangium cerinum TaxID=1434730 RepID=UPI003A940C05